MLNRLRQTAPAVALLICIALLATWLTGAHAHRHVGGQEQEHAVHAWAGMESDHEHGHSHELDYPHGTAADIAATDHGDGEHFNPHPVTFVHDDGHENVDLQALQPPAVKILLDFPLSALLCCAVLVLSRARTPVVVAIPDLPDPKRAAWSLRPPLRGPPSFSVV